MRIPVLSAVAGFSALLLFGSPVTAQPWTETNDRAAIPNAVEPSVHAFPLSSVRLLAGPFLNAMQKDAEVLFSYDPDRLLSGFWSESGAEPKAPPYGGWETDGLGGHTLGHWLSASSMYFAASGDSSILPRIDYVVDELAAIQAHNGNGYVAAIPGGMALWAAVRAREIDTSGFRLNGVWAPWYTLHKQFAGLLDVYWNTGNERALRVARDLADWAVATTADLTEIDWQTMLACEHGGMNEAMANLYGVTGESSYLALSRRFHHDAVLGPMARGVPNLTGLHSNTQIPKVIGVARQFELIGDDSLRTIADFFWEQMVNDHTYVNGGNSMGEYLGEPGELADRLDATSAETCNTYNMLRLTRQLFTQDPQARYGDYYERALYNHILASQDPVTGMFTYYMSLRPGHYKTYSTPEGAFWCCVGSGMENHVRYGEAIYFHGADELYVNLFIASELDWAERGIRVRQDTRFPDDPTTRLTMAMAEPTRFALRVRHPSWARGNPRLTINGEPLAVASEPGSFFAIDRIWQDGDILAITVPMSLRAEAMPDNPDRIAILYGPIVLGGALGTEGMPDGGAYADSDTRFVEEPTPAVPVLVADPAAITEWVQPLAGDPLTFHTVGAGRPADVVLKPFYRLDHERYTLYWDTFTPDGWAVAESDHRERQAKERRRDEHTVDVVRLGVMLDEADRRFESDRSEKGVAFGRTYRLVRSGGFMEFDVVADGDEGGYLQCTYWGEDAGRRTFDVSVDGVRLATESLAGGTPNTFVDRQYPVSPGQSAGRDRLRIRIEPHERNVAGRIFGCRFLDPGAFDDR